MEHKEKGQRKELEMKIRDSSWKRYSVGIDEVRPVLEEMIQSGLKDDVSKILHEQARDVLRRARSYTFWEAGSHKNVARKYSHLAVYVNQRGYLAEEKIDEIRKLEKYLPKPILERYPEKHKFLSDIATPGWGGYD